MKFARIENAVSCCKKHLVEASGVSQIAEVETYLVGFLLVVIYADYEMKLKKMLELRASRSGGDEAIQSFARHYIGKYSGRIYIEHLTELLKRFGVKCANQFKAEVQGKQAHTSWDNLMTNRHQLAHVTGSSVTFSEVLTDYRESHIVLNSFGRAIGMTTAELSKL